MRPGRASNLGKREGERGGGALSSNGVWSDAFRSVSKEILIMLNPLFVVSDRLAIVFKGFLLSCHKVFYFSFYYYYFFREGAYFRSY